MPTAKLTSKGQVTIPKEIRERLRLKTGDRLHFSVRDDGSVSVAADTRSILDLVGSIKPPPELRGLSLEEIDRRMREAVAGKVIEGSEP